MEEKKYTDVIRVGNDLIRSRDIMFAVNRADENLPKEYRPNDKYRINIHLYPKNQISRTDEQFPHLNVIQTMEHIVHVIEFNSEAECDAAFKLVESGMRYDENRLQLLAAHLR